MRVAGPLGPEEARLATFGMGVAVTAEAVRTMAETKVVKNFMAMVG